MEPWRAWRNIAWRARTIEEARIIHEDPNQGEEAMLKLAAWVYILFIRQSRIVFEDMYDLGITLSDTMKHNIALNRTLLPLVEKRDTYACLRAINFAFGFKKLFEGHTDEFCAENCCIPTARKAKYSAIVRAFRSCYRHLLQQESRVFIIGIVPLKIKIQIMKRVLASPVHTEMANRCLDHACIKSSEMKTLLRLGHPDFSLTRFWAKLRMLTTDEGFFEDVFASI
tara:strand:- start:1584 stop:2261 length:678 start_codon:yes stop_codon:yes gene_type:complete